MLKLTVALLVKDKACPGQVDLFRQIFPQGAPLTLAALTKAEKAGLDIWWCQKLLTGKVNDDYLAKCKSLYDDYEAKRKPLDDDYFAKRKSLLLAALKKQFGDKPC